MFSPILAVDLWLRVWKHSRWVRTRRFCLVCWFDFDLLTPLSVLALLQGDAEKVMNSILEGAFPQSVEGLTRSLSLRYLVK